MDARQDINLLVFLVQEIFQFPHFGFQRPDPFFQGLSVTSRESSSTKLIAGLTHEADVGALRTAGRDSITAYFLAPTAITSLSNPALSTRPHLDDLHWENARHDSGS